MNIQPYKNTRRIIIEPGEFYVSTQQEVISTLLGSCVSACLYDPITKVIGMNHFLLSQQHNQKKNVIITQAGRYGVHAMELLINDMLMRGATKKNMKAKCFGGAEILHTAFEKKDHCSIGEMNVSFIKEFLTFEKIPIVASSLGGKIGRNIHFMGHDNSVYMRKIDQDLERQIQKEEKNHLNKNLINQKEQTQNTSTNRIDFW
ncbi:MAG: chemotaxis protein CheD [Psychromonas sp.]|nr:chemotaxis protein CheD [Psychromonas sp.]